MAVSSSQTVVRSDIYFAAKDQALRKDVRRLGRLVGDLVKEQGGEALYDLVETARKASIAHREGDKQAMTELQALLAELAPRTARDLIRAFSTYFQMVNMAEKVHRIRRRRAYLKDTDNPQPFGFLDTLKRLKAEGVEVDDVEDAVLDICVQPVFTAHPTQTTRRTLLRKQQNIAKHLVEMLDPYMTPQEHTASLGQIRLEMTTGWQTEEHPDERRLGDEAEHILFFLTDVLYRMIPPLYESLEAAVESVYGAQRGPVRVPILVKFGSWVGGDMDGNPNVTAKSIRETLARQRSLLLSLYYSECRELARHLSQSESRIGISDEMRQRSRQYAGHFPKAAHAVPARHRKMPYRVFLRLIQARLQATFDDAAFPYESPIEFIADIEWIASSLRANHGQHAGLFAVKRLLRRARTFGFHMAQLDIRQHALVHRRVIGEGLSEVGWLEKTSEQRKARIEEALERRESPLGSLSSEARRMLAVFQTIAHCRRKYGIEAIGPYIVSAARGPEDLLAVLLLARWGHLGTKGADVPVDIVPLFETVDDLDNAASTMTGLLADERYRAHLRARENRQMVMIAYSDSAQDGGVISACWSLYKAQQTLVRTLASFGVKLTLFHGRGGTISGGGRVHEAVAAAPLGSAAGTLRLTEQGEMINAKYGLRAIAMRSLEQKISALIWVNAKQREPHAEEGQWRAVMEEIANASRRAYQALVYDAEDFERYFRAATPMDVIERLGIGMKTTAEEGADIEELEATPWEFAWTQNRCLLPGWFGFASGIRHGLAHYDKDIIAQLYENWPFFGVLVADIELALAKVDLDIAERYSLLAGDLHARFFPVIREEYEQCVAIVLSLSKQQKLLESKDALRRAIRLRNPYVDPMSFLQVDFLRRWRAGGRKDDEVLQALLASINGIAHGMQNTA
jgi:phosphoenolpyruvate carboxylase